MIYINFYNDKKLKFFFFPQSIRLFTLVNDILTMVKKKELQLIELIIYDIYFLFFF